jgi:hypothetical protein
VPGSNELNPLVQFVSAVGLGLLGIRNSRRVYIRPDVYIEKGRPFWRRLHGRRELYECSQCRPCSLES